MSSQLFNLSFKTFTADAFKDLLSEREFVNVTLVSDDDIEVSAHKVVLSASSPVFKRILLRNPHQHPLIYLSGVKHQELKGLINFMYLGQAEVSQVKLEVFMSLAARFQEKGLCQETISVDPVDRVRYIYEGNKTI